MTEIIQVEPAIDDEVVYDVERKRATHVESGLAVEYIHDDDPRERKSYFKLIFDGKEIPFEASTDNGREKIKKQYPNMDRTERNRLITALWESNFRTNNPRFDSNVDREIFVKVWQRVVKRENSLYKFSVYCKEWEGQILSERNHREWRCEA